jgi:hypothetical protein
MALNARTKKKVSDYNLFDVVYADGSQTSNRKVPLGDLVGEDKEGAIKAYLEEQDRKIAEASGKYRGDIKAILPAGR